MNVQNNAGYTAVMLASLTAPDGPAGMEVVRKLMEQGNVNIRSSQVTVSVQANVTATNRKYDKFMKRLLRLFSYKLKLTLFFGLKKIRNPQECSTRNYFCSLFLYRVAVQKTGSTYCLAHRSQADQT